MLPYIVIYLFFAIALAVVDRLYDRPLFIKTHSKHFPWMLNYSFKWWGVDEYWAGATVVSLVGLLVLFLWTVTGGGVNPIVKVVIFGLVCLSSTGLSIRHFGLVQRFKAHVGWMTAFTALGTLGLAIGAGAYADSFIVNTTRIDAAQFPLAQRAITTILLVETWAYIGTLFISASVFAAYLVIAAKRPTFIGRVKRDPLKSLDRRPYVPSLIDRREVNRLLVVAAGAFMTVLIVLNSWTYILRHPGDAVQKSLVFASFHLHPKDCGIPGQGDEAWVALISDNRAVLATPAKRGYRFETVRCDMQTKASLERARMERLKLDDYQ